MTIFILTSKSHWYSNVLLGSLMRRGVFHGDTCIVWEQDAIVPGKSHIAGLWKYIQTAGVVYVFWQVVKQFLFLGKSTWASMAHDRDSDCYPYYDLQDIERETVNGIKNHDIWVRVKKIKPDLILSLFSKEIITPELLKIPKIGAINIHPAPLPQYRGVSPTFWALAEGRKTHGVTLHTLDAGIDTGKIISQTQFPIVMYKTEHAMYLRCVHEGVELVKQYMRTVRSKKRVMYKTPVKGKSSYRSLPTKDAVRVFWERGMRFI